MKKVKESHSYFRSNLTTLSSSFFYALCLLRTARTTLSLIFKFRSYLIRTSLIRTSLAASPIYQSEGAHLVQYLSASLIITTRDKKVYILESYALKVKLRYSLT